MSVERDQIFVVEEIVLSVVEPSFGVSRIMYALFEHSKSHVKHSPNKIYLSAESDSTRRFVQVSFETHWEILSPSD